MTPIEIMMQRVKLTCCQCGQEKCDCWDECSCGMIVPAGTFCTNPKTERCSLKIRHGEYDRSSRKYVPKWPQRSIRPNEVWRCHPAVRKIVRSALAKKLAVPYSVTWHTQDEPKESAIEFIKMQIDGANADAPSKLPEFVKAKPKL